MSFLIIIVLLFVLMWLFLIRPQRRRQVDHAQMLAGLEVGDEIVTAGGLYGTVQAIEDDDVILEIAPGTNVRLAKRAVGAVMSDEEEDETEELEEPEEDEESTRQAESTEANPS